MRRALFLTLGLLELTTGVVLVVFGQQLPSGSEVDDSFGRADQVTAKTSTQVRLLRQQLHDLRRPELQQLALRLEVETRTAATSLDTQRPDYQTLQTMSDALGKTSDGLDATAASLDADSVGQVGHGLEATADYMDTKVAPTAEKAANGIEESAALLESDTKRLRVVAQAMPLDLGGVRDVHDSLRRFSESMTALNGAVSVQRFETMRDGFQGLETSLTTGAEQVERLASYTYPVVTFRGLKPQVEKRPFWPEGEKIAAGMRKAAAGAAAAQQQMDALVAVLPRINGSLDDSRKIADRTREALAQILKHQDTLEPLLRDLPAHTARLAEQLPKLGGDLAQVLRATGSLKEVAASLRLTQRALDAAVAHWPQMKVGLTASALLLRQSQQRLQQTLRNRAAYESAMRQTLSLSEDFARMLPLFIQQLEAQLAEQEQSLAELNASIDQVHESLPAYGRTTAQIVQTGRLLAWLFAALVGLHGMYLILSVRLGKQYSP